MVVWGSLLVLLAFCVCCVTLSLLVPQWPKANEAHLAKEMRAQVTQLAAAGRTISKLKGQGRKHIVTHTHDGCMGVCRAEC